MGRFDLTTVCLKGGKIKENITEVRIPSFLDSCMHTDHGNMRKKSEVYIIGYNSQTKFYIYYTLYMYMYMYIYIYTDMDVIQCGGLAPQK